MDLKSFLVQGLKNFGNSCWLNSLLQSLLFIEEYRILIIGDNGENLFGKKIDFVEGKTKSLYLLLKNFFIHYLFGDNFMKVQIVFL